MQCCCCASKVNWMRLYLLLDLRITHDCQVILANGQMAINGQIWPKWPFMTIWPTGHVRPIVASGVSLKRTKNVAQQ